MRIWAHMQPIEALGNFLTQTPEMLSQVHRWGNSPSVPRHERESVLKHTFRAVALTAAMVAIEEEQGDLPQKLDGERLLLAALLHDIGEGRTGDILYAVKQDGRVKHMLNEIEREQAMSLLKDLPLSVRDKYESAYRLESEDSIEGRFFNAVERMGYIYYSIEQYRDRGRKDFIETFQMQHEKILVLEEEFVSLKVLYGEFKEYIEKELELEQKARAFRETTGIGSK